MRTIAASTSRFGSGGGRRARRKASATANGASGSARTAAASASPSGPKTAVSGSAVFVSVWTERPNHGWKPPGRNFTPTTRPVPSIVRRSRAVRIPNTAACSASTARLTVGWFSSSWVNGASRSHSTIHSRSTHGSRSAAGRARVSR